MFAELEILKAKLGEAGFLSLVLEPLLSWGIAISLVLFLCSWILKEGKAQKVALLALVLCALSVIPFSHYFALAAEGVRGINPTTAELLQAQVGRLEGAQFPFIALAALAGLTFFLGRGGKAGLWLTVLTIVAGAAGAVGGLWLFLKSAEITHPELRVAPAVETAPQPAPAPALPEAVAPPAAPPPAPAP